MLLGLTGLPLFNYGSAEMIINRLQLTGSAVRLVTSINGVCLATALVYLCVLAWRQRKQFA